jgi:FAD/FMN-containing dehydrogenase
MPTQPTITRSHLDDRVRGRVIVSGDDDYDERRTAFMGGIDRRPAAIVMAADADDVARTVMFASETGVELAVRSGGHSGAGHSTTEGGILLDLRDLRALDIDVDARTAWVQPGLSAAEYTAEAGTYGLATGFGDAGSVGIGGITVGGGVGFLSRKYGMTIDDLLAADVVTADGRIRRVDADHEPDLFWAIRGGGGNFGVVTRLQLRLHPVGTVVGGMLMLPASADVIAGFIAEADRAPDELSTIANVMPAPPAPFVPEAVQGKLVVLAFMTFAGEADAGERALAPFRALAEPIADMLGAIPYPQMYMPEDEDYHPVAVSRTMFVDGIDRSVAETILEHLEASDASMRVAQLRVLGGAIARVPADATAFAHRGSKIMVNLAAFVDHPDQRGDREAWVETFHQAILQDDHGAYVNFVNDEGAERVHDAYPGPTWERLTEIKTRYDPTNLFHLNQNIPPRDPA